MFYHIKQQLDPSRLMNDQDGACSDQDVRNSLSFCSHQFDVDDLGCVGQNLEGSCTGADAPNKYHDVCAYSSDTHACAWETPSKIPVISHETGNCECHRALCAPAFL